MRYPEPSTPDPGASVLEESAVARRLDLAAATHEVEAMQFALQLAKRFRFTGFIDVGASGERDTDGSWIVGPTLELEVPIFDRKRGDVMRNRSILDMTIAERDALDLDIRTEVVAAAERLAESRSRLDTYAQELLPLHRALVQEAQLHHNAMLIGVYDLLEAKHAELETRRGAIAARRDYWLARTELERLTDGPLPEGNAATQTNAVPQEPATDAPATQHEHHDHKE